MGLDIYLSTAAERAGTDAHDQAWEEVYPSWDEMTDEAKAAWREAHPYPGHRSEVPSVAHPDHYWNRRYLRSSYNDGGFNSSVPDMVGEDSDLYWIFAPLDAGEDAPEVLDSTHVPLLNECKQRALAVAERLAKCDPLRTLTASPVLGSAGHLWSALPSEEQVLEWYRGQVERDPRPTFGSYSDGKGLVLGFDEGLEVLAATTARGVLGQPVAVLVYRAPEQRDHCMQAAEIAAEFCDEAVALIKTDGRAYWTWSG